MDASRPGSSPLGDDDLVRRAVAGEGGAFDALVERYQRRATSVAYRLLGDLHDALEVCQDAFLRAYRNLQSLEDTARFGPWLLRIVTNLSLNFRRSRSAGARRVSFEDCIRDDDHSADELVGDSSGSEDRPGAHLAASELASAVQAALAELPEAQRTALVLFSIEQMPQKDVAEIMNCSIEAVKWYVFQARRKLKERLADFL